MKKISGFILLSVCVALFASLGMVQASAAVTEKSHLVDTAGLLSDSEAEDISRRLDELSKKHDMDVVILTVNEYYSGRDIRVYAADLYEQNGFGSDGVELFVDPYDRDWAIIECGFGEEAFNEAARDYISDILTDDYLHDDDYYGAFKRFASMADEMIILAENGKPFTKPFHAFIAALISIAVGAIVGFSAAGAEKSKLKSVRFQPAASSYIRDNSMHVTNSKDFYMYSTTTRVRRAESDSSSHSGSISSSSGHSYTGSSGKY